MAHYAATKAAMVNMTKTAAIQYIPHGIRINAVAPTGVNTEMVRKFREESKAPGAQDIIFNPLGKFRNQMVEPADVAGAVYFLVGPDSTFITGQTLAIDGGYSAQ